MSDGRGRRVLGFGPGLGGSVDRDGRIGDGRSSPVLAFLKHDQEHGDVDQEREQLDAAEVAPRGRRRLGKGPAR